MGQSMQVLVREAGSFNQSRWRNSALDEYVERVDRGGRLEYSPSLAPRADSGESQPTASYRKREPVFGSLSAKRTR